MKKTPPPVTEKAPETSPEVQAKQEKMGFLEELLRKDERMLPYLDNKDSLKIQVIYTRIDRDKDNKPRFTDHFFNVDPAKYFYPASTVKLPTAMLALEKLNLLQQPGLNAASAMITENGYGKMTAVFNDPSTPDGRPSIAQYVKKVFLVSDNDAQNRMYEFLGQKYLNNTLWTKGYKEAQVIHRVDISLSDDENRHTNPVIFYDSSGRKIYEQPMAFNSEPYPARNDKAGKGYMKDGRLVEESHGFFTEEQDIPGFPA